MKSDFLNQVSKSDFPLFLSIGGMGNMGNNGGGMGNMGGNNMGGNNMNGFGSNNSNNMDALSQAYSGIQQYAGLLSFKHFSFLNCWF